MSRLLLQRTAGLAVALGLAALAAGRAADPPAPAKDDAPARRLLYFAKHREAKDLADLLGRYFQGAAEARASPAPANGLLIRAAPSAYDDVVHALEQLDRPARTVAVEVLIAEVAPTAGEGEKKADGDKPAPQQPELKEKDFTGPTADVAARMEDLRKSGALRDLRRVRLTTVEGRPASVLVGANRPFVTAINTTATGNVARSVTYRAEGTQAMATAWVSPDDVVTVDLRFEDARPRTPEDGPPIGNDEKGNPVRSTEFLLTTWDGKVSLPSGQARLVQDTADTAKSDPVRILVVVGARVVEPEAKPEK